MPALDGPALPEEPRNPVIESHNARLGLWLLSVYVIAYGVFMYLCAFGQETLAQPMGPLNVALVYGFGLIAGALILAILYLCLSKTNPAGDAK
jgi:uncharacterized membrane protein (DUF485 family)